MNEIWITLVPEISLCTWRYNTKKEKQHRVSTFENLLKSESLWSHPRLANLNKTRNALSTGFFFEILISIFQTINIGVNKLLLHLFLIGFCLFYSKVRKI